MADIGKMMTHEETVQALDALAKSREGGDAFRLRIMRRETPVQTPQIYALFEEAQVSHFVTPETWLPQLVGIGAGGIFELTAFHVSNMITPVGGIIKIPMQGETRPAAIEVVDSPGWVGPRRLSYPKPAPKDQAASFTLPTGGVGGDPNQRRDSLPGAPPPPLPSPAVSAIQPPQAPQLVAAEEAIRVQQRALEQQQQALREDKLRNEILASVKAQNEALIDTFKRTQEQTAQALHALAARDTKPAVNIEGVIAAVAPLVLGVMQSQAAARDEAAKRQDMILTTLLTKKETPAIDPGLQSILDRMARMVEAQATKPDGTGAMIAQMSEAMASMSNVTMQLVHTAAEMGVGSGPAPEPPWVKAVREGAKVITAMMQTQAQMATANAQRHRQMAPPPQQPPVLPQAPAPVPPNGAPVPLNGAAAAPVAAVPPQPAADPQAPAIDRIESAIRKHAPVARVVQAILNNVNDPSIMAAFMEAGGDVEVLFRKRLGPWLDDPANQPYMQSLMEAIQQEGAKRGLMEGGEEGEEGEEEDDGEEGDDGEEEATASA